MKPPCARRLAPLLFLLAGCLEKTSAPPPAPVVQRPATPTFHADIAPKFELHCALPSCHGTPQSKMVSLDLRAAFSYRELVNHLSEGRTGAVRVKPGDPSQSFLVDKLTGSLARGEGKGMPIDASTGTSMSPNPLAEWTETKLMPWIAAGAPDN